MKYMWHFESPIGTLTLAETDGAISHMVFGSDKRLNGYELKETPLIKKGEKQLKEYFAGKRKEFDLPLVFEGTDFQKSCWKALQTIPYGKTCSYKDIAMKIKNEKACRAVGGANNKNPIAIIVPCHRVIGANGSLVGFGGGLKTKQFLLDLEK